MAASMPSAALPPPRPTARHKRASPALYRNEAQIAVGMLLCMLPVLVRAWSFPLACLSAIWFLIGKLVLQKEASIGSHFSLATLQLSSLSLGTLWGACVASIAKIITPVGSASQLAALCVLGSAATLPVCAGRSDPREGVWVVSLVATVLFGSTIVLAQPLHTAADIWTHVVCWLLLGVLIANVAVALVGVLVMPIPASTRLIQKAAKLVDGTATALERCMANLCLPVASDVQDSIAFRGHILAVPPASRRASEAGVAAGDAPPHRLSEQVLMLAEDDMRAGSMKPADSSWVRVSPWGVASPGGECQSVVAAGTGHTPSREPSSSVNLTILHDELEEEAYLEMLYRATEPPKMTRLRPFQLQPPPPGAHLLPASCAQELKGRLDKAKLLLAPAGLEPAWFHAVNVALNKQWVSSRCGAGGATSAGDEHQACTTFSVASWTGILGTLSGILDSISALEGVARDMGMFSQPDAQIGDSVSDVAAAGCGKLGGAWPMWLAVRKAPSSQDLTQAKNLPQLHEAVRASLAAASYHASVISQQLKHWPLQPPRELASAGVCGKRIGLQHACDLEARKRHLSEAMLAAVETYWTDTVELAQVAETERQPLRMLKAEQMRAQYFTALATRNVLDNIELLSKQVHAAIHKGAPAVPPPPSPASPPAAAPVTWSGQLMQVASLSLFFGHLRACVEHGLKAVKGGKAAMRAAVSQQVFTAAVKYWIVAVVMLVAILCLQHFTPKSLSTPPIFGFITAAAAMRNKVESTLNQAVLRSVCSSLACFIGFGLMASPVSANQPILVAACVLIVCVCITPFKRTPFKFAAFLVAAGLSSVVLCQYQGCCGSTGSLNYAIERTLMVVVGSCLPVLVNRFLWPWWLSTSALNRAADSYVAGAALLQHHYSYLVDHLLHRRSASQIVQQAGSPSRDSSMWRTLSEAVSKLAGRVRRLSIPGKAAATDVTMQRRQSSPGEVLELSDAERVAAAAEAARRRSLASLEEASRRAHPVGQSGHKPLPMVLSGLVLEPESAEEKKVSGDALGGQRSQEQAVPGAVSIVVRDAAEQAAPEQAKPVTQADVQGPLSEVIADLGRDATVWSRGVLSTPHAVHALVAAITVLADRLSSLQVALRGAEGMSQTFSSWVREHLMEPLHPEVDKVILCISQLAELTKALVACKPNTPQHQELSQKLKAAVKQVVQQRARAHRCHLHLRQELHVKVVKLAKQQAAKTKATAALTAATTALTNTGSIAQVGAEGGEVTSQAAAQPPGARVQSRAQHPSPSPFSQVDPGAVPLPGPNAGSVSALADWSHFFHPSDTAVWLACVYALTHAFDAGIHVARVAVALVGGLPDNVQDLLQALQSLERSVKQ